MCASIREFGFKIPCLVRSDGEVVDGHLRLKAARKLGITEIPVILCDEWTPERLERSKLFLGNFSYTGLARLKPGVTLEQANADLARMIPIWVDSWPLPRGFNKAFFVNARLSPRIRALKEDVVGDIGQLLWVLMGTIGLVLLIACANVANLLLVRAGGRQQ
jgi:hypothetical protein